MLEDVSLTAAPGKITCLLGSNGSGKTTLIRSILGLTPPSAGRIRFGGADHHRAADPRVIAAGIACIPEGRKVFPKFTVEENLRIGAYQETLREPPSPSGWRDVYETFPRLAERRDAARRHHVGRRAGHDLDRPRTDARAEAAADRRAVARACRRSW